MVAEYRKKSEPFYSDDDRLGFEEYRGREANYITFRKSVGTVLRVTTW